MAAVQVVTPAEYRAARLSLLAKEKEATRVKDALAAERRSLPIVEVTKSYTFTVLCGKDGQKKQITLLDLFAGRRQLIVYHFMFDPSWKSGCTGCTLLCDAFPTLEHLHSRSTSAVAVSRAPVEKLEAYKKRMGWNFPWLSSLGSDFNYDMHVTQDEAVCEIDYNFKNKDELLKLPIEDITKGEQPGTSVFYRGDGKIGEEGKIYHTYSTYARGSENLINTFDWLDLTPLGRQDGETGLGGVGFRRKDEYSEEELRGLH